MSMFSIFGVSGSAISAQSQRLNVVASNLANADAVAGPDGKAYKARHLTFQTVAMGSDGSAGVRIEGAPLNPSDLGLLFGAADMATARSSGSPGRARWVTVKGTRARTATPL